MIKKILFLLQNKTSFKLILYFIFTVCRSKLIYKKYFNYQLYFHKKITKKKFNFLWFMQSIPFICYFLKKNKSIKNILEIGSFEGLASYFFLHFFKNSYIICLDPFENPNGEKYNQKFSITEKNFDQNLREFNLRFKKIKKTSRNYFKQDNNDKKFCLIYIDGAHNADDVFYDALSSWNVLKKNGFIIFDDVFFNELDKGRNVIDGINKFYNLKKKNIKIIALYSQLIIMKN